MTRRNIHYEAAFEGFLRSRACPYVAVDEAKRAAFAQADIKSFDFIVYCRTGPNLLIDVKGRKFPDPTGRKARSRPWENWVTREDVSSLAQWEQVFGDGFRAALVFAYWLQGTPQESPFLDVHLFRGKYYAFQAIRLADYLRSARPRSPKWKTLSMPTAEFTRTSSPIEEVL